MTAAGKKSAKGLTLDTGALLALERGSPRVRALLRRALEAGLPLSVPAVDVHVVLAAQEQRHTVVTSDPEDLRAVHPGLPLIEV
ncbi:MAG: hypothetical protein ACFNME_13260 [Actinomyces dentalis]